MWRSLRLRVRLYYVAVVGCGVAGVAAVTWPGNFAVPPLQRTGGVWPVAVLLMAATAGSAYYSDVLAGRAGHRILVTFAPAFHLAAALMLPLPLGFLVPSTTVGFIQLRVRPARFKQLFNAAVYVLAMVAAASAFGIVWGDSRTPSAFVVAAVLACLAYGLVDVGAFAAYFWLASGLAPRDSGLLALWEIGSQLMFGVLLAGLWTAGPVLVLLLVPLAVMLQRAVVLRSLELASRTEPKTGLLNDRAFRAGAAQILARASRNTSPTAFLMLDLDYLREINNAHGHLVGDLVIEGIAEVLRAELRDRDIAARFGGEEFAVLLPTTNLDEALRVAERVRASFAARTVEAGAAALRASVSIGVSTSVGTASLEDLTRRADAALYEAKAAGRDCVRAAEQPSASRAVPPPRSHSQVVHEVHHGPRATSE